jgi:hypothetical protein
MSNSPSSIPSVYNRKLHRPAISVEEAHEKLRTTQERFAGMSSDQIDEQIEKDLQIIGGKMNNPSKTAEQNIAELPVTEKTQNKENFKAIQIGNSKFWFGDKLPYEVAIKVSDKQKQEIINTAANALAEEKVKNNHFAQNSILSELCKN